VRIHHQQVDRVRSDVQDTEAHGAQSAGGPLQRLTPSGARREGEGALSLGW
jgi:hypothetical protein